MNVDELAALPTISARLKWCKENLWHVSDGSSRSVFISPDDDGHVWKIAKNRRGIAQNKAEFQVWQRNIRSPWLATTIYSAENGSVNVQEQAAEVEPGRWPSVTFEEAVFRLAKRNNMSDGEMCDLSNIGIVWRKRGRQYVVVDYGYTAEVAPLYGD